MAWDDWGDDSDYFDDPTPDYKDVLFGNDNIMDSHAQELFVEAYFDGNDKAYIDLAEYMWDEYGIVWDDVFEWEDFRDWYEAQ